MLVLGNYAEASERGEIARRYLTSLLHTGDDVVCRPLHLAGRPVPPTPEIAAAEARPFDGRGAVLQIAPLDCLTVLPVARNIALLVDEDDPGVPTWADAEFEVAARPGRDLPVPCDADWYCRGFVPIPELRQKSSDFRFYTAGDSSDRVNLFGLFRAFFHAFRPGDGVELVVRANDPGVEPLVGRAAAGRSAHAPVRIVSRSLTPAEGAGLALACDCYATAARAAVWDLDAYDAALFGKTPIAPDWGAYGVFLGGDEPAGYLVRPAPEPDGRGRVWAGPVLTELAAAMTAAASDRAGRSRRASAGRALADQFSYEAVGPGLRGLVCRTPTH